jgi:hypothetical protein
MTNPLGPANLRIAANAWSDMSDGATKIPRPVVAVRETRAPGAGKEHVMVDRWKRYGPLAGVLFVALTVAALVTPQTPDTKASGAKVITFFHDHHNSMVAAEYLLAFAGIFAIAYFVSVADYLRRCGSRVLATMTVAGAIVAAGGFFLGAGLMTALTDRTTSLTPDAAQALNFLQDDAFAPLLFAGLAIATTSMGAAMLRTKALPKALGIITVVVGAALATGFVSWFAFLASGPLTLVVAGYVYKRLGRPESITLPGVPEQRAVAADKAAEESVQA